ncbi:hypothetical protein Tco_0609234 [Tanacetum coccineum]
MNRCLPLPKFEEFYSSLQGHWAAEIYSVWDSQLVKLATCPCAVSSRVEVVHIVLWIVDSGCSKHMTAITGYGDYIQGDITICHIYYVEGLGHNLFSVVQFCDGDLEVAFHSKTCYVRNLEGDDLLTGDRESNLYAISISDMAASSPVCLSHEEIESSTTALESSNVQNFHQVQPSTHIWTKDHPLDQVIGDPSKPVMTRQRLHTDSKVCMYALTVSTIEPKNIKEAMAATFETKLACAKGYKQEKALMLKGGGGGVSSISQGIFISQSQYAIELLKKHGLDECVSMSTPMATERLDADLQHSTDQRLIVHVIRSNTSKRLNGLSYLRQSYNMGLWYPKDSGFELIAYSDADHAGCKDDCKSTSGGLQFLHGKLMSWSLKKQDCTAMSTAEAEYVSLFCMLCISYLDANSTA